MIEFQLLDVDYILNNNRPVLRLFGKTENGKSITVFFEGFQPYFYIKPNEGREEDLQNIPEIIKIEKVEKYIPLGYNKNPTRLLKLTLTNPQDVPRIRELIKERNIAESVYEADILFKYRFMIDYNLRGINWVAADVEKIYTKTVKGAAFRAKNVWPIERTDSAELKYMAFDIECIPSDPRKPLDARKDPIVMIALAFDPPYRGGKTLVLVAKPVSGEGVKGFPNEKEMLEEFMNVTEQYDCDILTGYNINSFDLPYILERLKQHNIFCDFGKCEDKQVFSKKIGIIFDCVVPGRVVVDPYQILKRDPWVRFNRYNLNTVAKIMLGEEKLDVEYGDMINLWNGKKAELMKFIEYSRKDADLSLRLLMEKGLLDRFFELSKLSGVLLQDALGGQTARIETAVMHEFRDRNFVMPEKPSPAEITKRNNQRAKLGLKGAVVLEPERGLHADGCVLVLDFKSLYPSIMRTFNVSPDSLILGDEENVYQSPTGAKFISEKEYVGIFPHILTNLIKSRAEIKKKMATAAGDEKRILDAKQLAVKTMANSFYGYTGYARARLYMLEVANTITGIGRENIEKTRDLVESVFPVKVVYGDTDSIFVKVNTTNLEESKKIGEDIAKYVTERLPGYLELDFEKIYRTFLILTKKRYTGWKFSKKNDEWISGIDMKGIETVRRDWCPLVTETMEELINIILKEGDVQKSMDLVKGIIEKIKNNEIPMDKLTIIKGITKSLESYEGTLPHIELARKLAARNTHDPPKVGDRLGFVIIKGNQMLSKRAEDPKYIIEHNIQIDPNYYIHSQLFPPIERIFSSMGITKSELLGSGYQVNLLDLFGGKKRKLKHDISVDTEAKDVVNGWEEFVCKKCNKSHKRMPLRGVCECGGELLISYQGSVGTKMITKPI